jgi:4-amino-4-deoxy-L-arabinose transferase-like glycosyltransferase
VVSDPWLPSPPLYYWLAVLCGQAFQWLLPWHDAARLATTLLGAGFLFTLSTSVRYLADSNTALIAPLLAIGTLGLLVPMHDAQPAIAGIFGFSLALLGLIQASKIPLHGGILFGAGVGISFLGVGIDGALLSIVTGLLVCLHPAWRQRDSLVALLAASSVAMVLILPWPWLLNQKFPLLFDLWWTTEMSSLVPRTAFTPAHIKLLMWTSWPLLPLAIWQLWLERRRLWLPQTVLPLIASLTALVFFFLGNPRPTSLLPTLVPLSILAATGAGRLRRGAANAFDWFGMVIFSLMHLLIWIGAIALLTGTPEKIAKNFTKPTPGFVAHTPFIVIMLATLISIGWLAYTLSLRRSPWRAATRWSIGWITIWLLITALWLPWIDYGKSYRIVSADFSQRLGKNPGCIARRNLGLAQRASLYYFNGIRTTSGDNAKTCRYLITQTRPQAEKSLTNWQLILETSRPGDKTERLRLYQRN